MLSRRFASLAAALVLALLAHEAPAMQPFDPAVPRLEEQVRLPRWERAHAALIDDGRRLDACLAHPAACEGERLRAWRGLVLALADAAPTTALAAVNDFVNAVPYASDREAYGLTDFWAGPWQFLQSRGDCEDYAIAKYATLKRLGFRAADMQILVVEDLVRDLAHAVLAVRVAGRVWLLDNQAKEPVAAAESTRYRPYYAVNEEDRWLHRLPSAATSAR